mmetsp:Transcript_8834/g.25460  ORF Transcript_8834/g.25460 Transcript_8834/m.25460 type:complete len:230 (-) Transcript_8834:5408-6097(-)
MDKRLEGAEDRFPVGAEHLQRDAAHIPEDALNAGWPKGIDEVLRQAEGHHLRLLQSQTLVEEHAEVHVDDVACGAVDEEVLSVAVPEAKDVAYHRPHGCRAGETEAGGGPVGRSRKLLEKPPVEHRREHLHHLVVPGAPPVAGGLVMAFVKLPDLRKRVLVVQPGGSVDGGAALAQAHGVVHPLDDAAVLREGDHVEGAQVEVAPTAGRVLLEEPVEQLRELHQPLVLP